MRTRPNLLVVFPDQMRGSAMGFTGQETVFTPNLDRFASESLVLTQAISNRPLCSPFRAMLMTGTYPLTNGVTHNCNSDTARFGCELRAEDRCWSDVLKDAGYSLGYIGKWHLDAPREPFVDTANNHGVHAWNEWCPPARRHGFDHWYAYGTYDIHTRPMYWAGEAARDGFHYVDQWGPEHEADKAMAYLRNEGGNLRRPDRPFALVVSMNPPHTPYDLVPERYVERYAGLPIEALCRSPAIPPAGTRMGDHYRQHIRNYLAMVTGVDEQFGRILAALEASGEAENTIVVFTSDHGNSLGMHHQQTKTSAYEESIRIPFLIRWPGHLAARQDELLLSAPDIYPTLMGLMGLESQIPATVEGGNYAGALRGEDDAERPESQLYLRFPLDGLSGGARGVRTHRHTLVISRGYPRTIELYDREQDPHQVRNVADKAPDRVTQLTGTLMGWLRRTGDLWVPS